MSQRLYRVLKDNRSLILYGLVRSLRNSALPVVKRLTFEELYTMCDNLIEGLMDLTEGFYTQKLQKLFSAIGPKWTQLGYGIGDIQKILTRLRTVCLPFIDNRHNPQIRTKLKLDMVCYLTETVTLFSTTYHKTHAQSTMEDSNIFELIFKETGDCIFSIDPQQNIKVINPAMERFLGVSPGEVLGKKCYEVLHWKERDIHESCRISCPLMKEFEAGASTAYSEGLIELKRWKKRWTGTTASCVRDDKGGILEIILVMRDISASKDIQRKLEEEIKTYETLANSTRGIELKIPCLSEFAITARAQAELIAKRMKFKEDRIQDIKSMVGEACDNAIEHSNSPHGVDIRYKVQGPNLLIEVEDYGDGFEPEQIGYSLPSPFVEGGRGLYLMRNLADEVQIVSKKGQGTKVTMEVLRKSLPYKQWKAEKTWKAEKKVCVM